MTQKGVRNTLRDALEVAIGCVDELAEIDSPAPAVTRDELAAHLDSCFHGDNWDEIAEEVVLFFDVRHRPTEGSDTNHA